MKPIERSSSYYETCFRIQEAVSGADIGREFFLSDIAPNVPDKSHRNYYARAMQCLIKTRVKGKFGQPQFSKTSDPRLTLKSLGEGPSLRELRQLPYVPDSCSGCNPPFTTCLILLAYQREVSQRIRELGGE